MNMIADDPNAMLPMTFYIMCGECGSHAKVYTSWDEGISISCCRCDNWESMLSIDDKVQRRGKHWDKRWMEK